MRKLIVLALAGLLILTACAQPTANATPDARVADLEARVAALEAASGQAPEAPAMPTADGRVPDLEARLTALHAKAHLGDVAREVARMTTETHGGMGFTDLLGLHVWFKRVSFNRQVLGGPERCREEAAQLQGWV